MSDDPAAEHWLITGRVQGVGYRAWLTEAARTVGVRGWVRNLEDGRVEAVVSGAGAVVEALARRARSGPAGAAVERIERRPRPDGSEPADQAAGSFAQRPTARTPADGD